MPARNAVDSQYYIAGALAVVSIPIPATLTACMGQRGCVGIYGATNSYWLDFNGVAVPASGAPTGPPYLDPGKVSIPAGATTVDVIMPAGGAFEVGFFSNCSQAPEPAVSSGGGGGGGGAVTVNAPDREVGWVVDNAGTNHWYTFDATANTYTYTDGPGGAPSAPAFPVTPAGGTTTAAARIINVQVIPIPANWPVPANVTSVTVQIATAGVTINGQALPVGGYTYNVEDGADSLANLTVVLNAGAGFIHYTERA